MPAPNNNLQVPGMNMDGPSDTRSQHGGSQRGSQYGGSARGSPQASPGRSQRGSPPGASGSQRASQAGGSQRGSPPGDSQSGGSRSRSGSSAGPPRASGPQMPFPPGPGHDPAFGDDELDERFRKSLPIRVDLPPEAFIRDFKTSPFATRPKQANNAGKIIPVRVNQFRLTGIRSPKIWQYDINVGALSSRDEERRDLITSKCWKSNAVQSKLRDYKGSWLCDGKRLAWSLNNVESLRILVNLDEEKGRPTRPGSQANAFWLTITRATSVELRLLEMYLQGKCEWDNAIMECLNFFDHVIREGPSQRMTAIKRNFYSDGCQYRQLDSAVACAKGIYASFRLGHVSDPKAIGLGINVDVANTAFWHNQTFDQVIKFYLGTMEPKWDNKNEYEISDILRPDSWRHPVTGVEEWVMPHSLRCLRRLHRLRFNVYHRHKENDAKTYTLLKFGFDPKYGQEGANSKTVTFVVKSTGEERSIYDHFWKQYRIRLRYWRLPVMLTTRDGAFPPEVCHMPKWSRYNFKLDPAQTASMIKFAVTRPKERATHIMKNVEALGWGSDKYLREMGITISPEMTKVNAKLIANPKVQYGNQEVNPGTSGRWDLRGKTFLTRNVAPMLSWAFVTWGVAIDKESAKNFATQLVKTYKSHGGRIDEAPVLLNYPGSKQIHEVVAESYKATGDTRRSVPTIMFVVLPDKNAFNYYRFKKSFECRFGMVSQMLNVNHVKKAQGQYISNVCMKVNAKLGGQNTRLSGASNTKNPFFSAPTVMIGCDVSHGGAVVTKGVAGPEASMAAMTMSMDIDAAKYAAACDTNGFRNEIVSPLIINRMMPGMIQAWRAKNNNAQPRHVFYIRDGVAEGQFNQVLEYEVKTLRQLFKEHAGIEAKFTVIIATKRHHIRFFPEQGDKNGNPLPGTLIDTEVTHPFHYDFYLCSHVAIQGTARPVHYTVLVDEVGMSPEMLQRMIYHQCYQYARSTTPVSLHPAVYYAHLAGARARAHENVASSQRDPKFVKEKNWAAKGTEDGGSITRETTSQPVLPIGTNEADERNVKHTKYTMWYI